MIEKNPDYCGLTFGIEFVQSMLPWWFFQMNE